MNTSLGAEVEELSGSADGVLEIIESIRITAASDIECAKLLREVIAGLKEAICDNHRRAYNHQESSLVVLANIISQVNVLLVNVKRKLDPYHLRLSDDTSVNKQELSWDFSTDEFEELRKCSLSIIETLIDLEDKEYIFMQKREKESMVESSAHPRTRPAPGNVFSSKLITLRNYLIKPERLGSWVSVADLKSWFNHCHKFHGDHCTRPPEGGKIPFHYPRWLVDVDRYCLVQPEGSPKYAALSYVWGTERPFQALKRNIEFLQQKGSLASNYPRSTTNVPGNQPAKATEPTLPLTIVHAIELMRILSVPYIWIDALCIIQDDLQTKHEALRSMSSIYANASFTLVSSSASAQTGLHGIPRLTPPFARTTETHPGSSKKSFFDKIVDHSRRLRRSPWSKRAWTFQEQIFSPRLLIFEPDGASWECHCSVFFDSVRPPPFVEPCRAPTAYSDSNGVSKPAKGGGYGIEEYGGSQRIAPGLSLSMHPVFAEYAEHVTAYNKRQLTFPEDVLEAFEGVLGVLDGVFEGGFVAGLPVMYLDAALLWFNEKTLERRIASDRAKESSMPPSWSWAAWGGEVKFPESVEELKGLVQWTYRESDGHTWHALTTFQTISNIEEALARLDVSEPSSASNEASPGPEAVILSSARLRTVAYRAYFPVMELFGDNNVFLGDKNDKFAGALISCEKSVESIMPKGTQCEVIAISEQITTESRLINVLWIYWKGGLAYRRGVGRVTEEAWKTSKWESLEVILA